MAVGEREIDLADLLLTECMTDNAYGAEATTFAGANTAITKQQIASHKS